MKDKRWILGLFIVVAAIVALGIWGFKNSGKDTTSPQVSGESTEIQAYFDENATVMYFYQDTCSWCIKEKDVLTKLGAEGYRVKPMNIGANQPDNQGFWQQYNISGTPAFIAKNGDRLEGYSDYNKLKPWLDQHK